MKKCIALLLIVIIFAGTFLASAVSVSVGVLWIGNIFENIHRTESFVIDELTAHDPNANIAVIGDNRIYFHNKVITDQDVPVKEPHFILVDSAFVYYYTIDKQNSSVILCRADHDFRTYEQVFQSTCDNNSINVQVRDPGIICFQNASGRFACYDTIAQAAHDDLSSDELDSLSSANQEYTVKITLENNLREVVITNLKTSDESRVSTDQLKGVLMEHIETEPDNFGISQVCVRGDDLYIQCRTTSLSVITFYKYDLKQNFLTFCGWREVIDHEGTQMFILTAE